MKDGPAGFCACGKKEEKARFEFLFREQFLAAEKLLFAHSPRAAI